MQRRDVCVCVCVGGGGGGGERKDEERNAGIVSFATQLGHTKIKLIVWGSLYS